MREYFAKKRVNQNLTTVSVFLKGLSNNSNNPQFKKQILEATELLNNIREDFEYIINR